MKTKYFLYARKSAEDEERQVMSIEAQLVELEEYAKREKIEISERFIESKSAKKPGREILVASWTGNPDNRALATIKLDSPVIVDEGAGGKWTADGNEHRLGSSGKGAAGEIKVIVDINTAWAAKEVSAGNAQWTGESNRVGPLGNRAGVAWGDIKRSNAYSGIYGRILHAGIVKDC